MAVKIPANTSCDIVFHYKTPGLSAGVAISLISLAGFCIYIVGVNVFRRRKKNLLKHFTNETEEYELARKQDT